MLLLCDFNPSQRCLSNYLLFRSRFFGRMRQFKVVFYVFFCIANQFSKWFQIYSFFVRILFRQLMKFLRTVIQAMSFHALFCWPRMWWTSRSTEISSVPFNHSWSFYSVTGAWSQLPLLVRVSFFMQVNKCLLTCDLIYSQNDFPSLKWLFLREHKKFFSLPVFEINSSVFIH